MEKFLEVLLFIFSAFFVITIGGIYITFVLSLRQGKMRSRRSVSLQLMIFALGLLLFAVVVHRYRIEKVHSEIMVRELLSEAWVLFSGGAESGTVREGRKIDDSTSKVINAKIQEALALDFKSSRAHQLKCMVLIEKDKLEEAEAECRIAVDLSPESLQGINALGIVLDRQGKLGQAIEQYRIGILHARNVALYNNLAIALQRQSAILLDESIEIFRKAIEIEPDNADCYSGLGKSLYEKGEVDAAIENLRRAIEIDPNFASPHATLGRVFYRIGQVQEAIEEYKRAADLKPLNLEYQEELAKIQGDHSESSVP